VCVDDDKLRYSVIIKLVVQWAGKLCEEEGEYVSRPSSAMVLVFLST